MKLTKLKILATTITTMLIGGCVTLPAVFNQSTVTNQYNTSQDEMIQTGKILHSESIQVVDNVANIIIKESNIGNSSSYAIVETDGVQEIYVWGDNSFGQLGLGDTYRNINVVTEPTLMDMSVFGEFNRIDLYIGSPNNKKDSSYMQTLSIGYAIIHNETPQQRFYTWGLNTSGQLGNDTSTNVYTPTLIDPQSLGNYDKIDFVRGLTTTLFVVVVKDDKQLIFSTGSNSNGQCGTNGPVGIQTGFRQIDNSSITGYKSIHQFSVCNESASAIFVMSNGDLALFVWGYNGFGNLGLGHRNDAKIPTKHTNTAATSIFSSSKLGDGKLQIGNTSYFLDGALGQLYTWGANGSGQLGHNDTTNLSEPKMIPSVSFLGGFIKDAGVSYSSYAVITPLRGNDVVYVWGDNTGSSLGLGHASVVRTPTPMNMQTLGNPDNVKTFRLGVYGTSVNDTAYTLVVKNEKTLLYVWGINANGQLGTGDAQPVKTPHHLNFGSKDILAANFEGRVGSVTLLNDGEIEYLACGNNSSGQLGMANTNSVTSLQKIMPPVSSRLILHSKTFDDVSATDVLNKFVSPIWFDKNALAEYVNIATFPPDAKLNVTEQSKSNASEGYIDLEVSTDCYYKVLLANKVPKHKLFTIRINGFKKVKDVPIITKYNPNLSSSQFYEKAIIGGVTNRKFLEQYLDLSCIPNGANIKIEKLETADSNKIEFSLSTDKVYQNNGTTTVFSGGNEFRQLFSFPLPPKGIELMIIVAIIAGSCIIAIIIYVTFYMSASKVTYIDH